MKKIAFVVDSSSGIKKNEIKNVFVVDSYVNCEKNKQHQSYRDGIDINNKQLLDLFKDKSNNISTSQPPYGEILTLIEQINTQYDEIYAFPIPGKLSSSVNTWKTIAMDFENLFVYDTYMIGEFLKRFIIDLKKQVDNNTFSKEKLEQEIQKRKNKWCAFLIVPNVDQLVKGGRISNFKSLLIKLLNLKLIIKFNYEGLNFYDKASNLKDLMNKIENGFNESIDLKNHEIYESIIFSSTIDKSKFNNEELNNEIIKNFNLKDTVKTTIPSLIMAHIGPYYSAIYIRIK